jgi:translation initiation factor 1
MIKTDALIHDPAWHLPVLPEMAALPVIPEKIPRQCQVINKENRKIHVMIGGICPTCGLPKELCICEEVAKEQQRINVKVNKRRYGKEVTVIEGLDPTDIDLEDLSKYMKGKLACGGTVKGNSIELQGNHRDRVKELLSLKGYSTENIS